METKTEKVFDQELVARKKDCCGCLGKKIPGIENQSNYTLNFD